MAKKIKLGSTKRYGTRYGHKNKEKVAAIEKEHRGKHKCPYCNYVKVRRLSKGIWQCEKCDSKFAGKAYTFVTAKPKKETVKKKKKAEVIEEDFEELDPVEEKEVEQPEVA